MLAALAISCCTVQREQLHCAVPRKESWPMFDDDCARGCWVTIDDWICNLRVGVTAFQTFSFDVGNMGGSSSRVTLRVGADSRQIRLSVFAEAAIPRMRHGQTRLDTRASAAS